VNKLPGISRRGLRFSFLMGLCALLLALLAPPRTALAHPLDVYLQATYITVAPTQVEVELALTPGALVVGQVLPQLDPDGDQQITETEERGYVATVLRHVLLETDGKPLVLTVTKIDMPPYLNLQAGYGTIRIFTTASLEVARTGSHQLYYKNSYAPIGGALSVAYQVNAVVGTGAAVTLGKPNRDDIQQSMTMEFVFGDSVRSSATPVTPGPATTAITSLVSQFELLAGASRPVGSQARQLLAYLYAPTQSPWVLLLTLALALALGGLHALTPGHGKTLVAAYLVGSRGTVKHAIFLGGIVTFTHTASVIVIGLLALFASRFVMPNVLMPILETLSGLLVVYMGARLIWQRWHVFRSNPSHEQGHSHEHEQSHEHGHTHAHEVGAAHHHGDGHVHTHLPPVEGINLSNLLAMGVSGGLVPCPEALGIMVIAIGLNRILLGLGLIVSFSFGLAAVLIAIGILLVRSRSLVDRFGGMSGRWSSALPFASAMIVTVLGVGMTLSGLATYWR
jgi:ABC-type nickel/cobalt efflux system permease component RcnA